MKEKVVNSAKKLARKKTRNRVLKIILVIIVLFLINLYIVLRLMYIGENFTVTLDSEYGRESGLVVYEDPNDIKIRTYLKSEPINYWATIEIEDVIKNVDEAIRVMVIKNGERTIYAKKNKSTGNAENNTQPFYSDNVIMLEKNENFQVDSEDKYTIVIWVEGDDPDCTDELIGGEIKMNMRLTEEHINLENN